MGKLRRQRHKFHVSKNIEAQGNTNSSIDTAPLLPLTPPKENLFAGLNINLENLKNMLEYDVQSVKSYKSVKSESGKKIIPKKEKLKLRRDILLKKIDTVKQMRKVLKLRQKRKKTCLIGDTNPLHDALPSLEPLLKSSTNIKYNIPTQNTKKKGIDKATHRKKKLVQDVTVFRQTLKNKDFKKNPFEAITNHIKAIAEQGKRLSKKQIL